MRTASASESYLDEGVVDFARKAKDVVHRGAQIALGSLGAAYKSYIGDKMLARAIQRAKEYARTHGKDAQWLSARMDQIRNAHRSRTMLAALAPAAMAASAAGYSAGKKAQQKKQQPPAFVAEPSAGRRKD